MNAGEQWQVSHKAAEAYERIVARYILGPWAPLLVDAVRLVPGEHVLDVACGTGVVARVAAEHVGAKGHVTGIDLNPGMIAVAGSIPNPAGAPISWIERSASDLGISDASIDAVLCQQGLQFFPNKSLAMREMQRVLRPGGRLALSVWNSAGLYNTAVGGALSKLVSHEIAERFLASRRAPKDAEILQLAAEAGFFNIKLFVAASDVHLPNLATFVLKHLSATPVASAIASVSPEVRKQIGDDVTTALIDYADGDGVAYPEETYVLTASKRL